MKIRLSDNRILDIISDKDGVSVTLAIRTWDDGTIKEGKLKFSTSTAYVDDYEWNEYSNTKESDSAKK